MLYIPKTVDSREQLVESFKAFFLAFGVEPNVMVLDPNSVATLKSIGRVAFGHLYEDQPDILVGRRFFGCTIEFGTRFDLRRVKE